MICGTQGLRRQRQIKNNRQTYNVICFWKRDDKYAEYSEYAEYAQYAQSAEYKDSQSSTHHFIFLLGVS